MLRGLYDLSGERYTPIEIANIIFFIAISEDGWRRMLDLEKKKQALEDHQSLL